MVLLVLPNTRVQKATQVDCVNLGLLLEKSSVRQEFMLCRQVIPRLGTNICSFKGTPSP